MLLLSHHVDAHLVFLRPRVCAVCHQSAVGWQSGHNQRGGRRDDPLAKSGNSKMTGLRHPSVAFESALQQGGVTNNLPVAAAGGFGGGLGGGSGFYETQLPGAWIQQRPGSSLRTKSSGGQGPVDRSFGNSGGPQRLPPGLSTRDISVSRKQIAALRFLPPEARQRLRR